MQTFENYKGEECILTDEQEDHLLQRHHDATFELIFSCLKDPIEIRQSSSKQNSHLFYITKTEDY